ncbi:MAG: tetratricopeptide repeat protein [Nostoc sp.]|uniref:tetratricopeptide repeat protein n=1 Tax=Nostoc sp. TaxID=1180 RepID=UPI002FF9B457
MAKGFGTQKQKKGIQNHKYYLDFLLEVLQVTHDSNGNSQAISSLLQTNLNKLDDKLIQVWRSWALDTLFRVDAEKAHAMAVDIVNFSNLIQDFSLGFPAINLEIAIIGYQMVESVFSHKIYQEEWATAQNSLGNAYCKRLRGERSKNLETAIICYQNALQVYNREKFPERWADTQSNLGNAYLDRIRGDRFDNLEIAIICYQNTLQVYNHEKFHERWADTQNNLGNAYLDKICGDQSENLKISIVCYQNALQIYNQKTFPKKWAGIKINLGNAYCKTIGIDRLDNIEQVSQ